MSITSNSKKKRELRSQVARYVDGLVTGWAKENRCDEITSEAHVKQAMRAVLNQMD
jgi:hypothetical protein